MVAGQHAGGPVRTHQSGWDSCIVVVAGTPWEGMRSSERALAAQLASHQRVLWVDPPVSLARPSRSRLSRAVSGPVLQSDGTVTVHPMTVPGVSRPVLREVAAAQSRRAVRTALNQLGATATAVLVASTADMLDCAPGALRVFYGTDDFVAGAGLMGLRTAAVQAAERRQLATADLVLAVSPALCERWAAMGVTPALLPNGADVEAMAAVDTVRPADDVNLPGPVAGFVGHISGRLDLALLAAVADRGVSLLLVGPVPRSSRPAGLEALLARPNVLATGVRPFTQLPAYYRHMDVGLTPYADNAFNRASFPLKTLEYLAAGLPVVATDLPANDYLAKGLVRVGADAASFANQVVEALAGAHAPAQVLERRRAAAEHSWGRRAEQVLELIGAAAPARYAATSGRRR